MVNKEAYKELSAELGSKGVTLVAVSKLKPVSDILALYELGHRDFGENYVQELVDKQSKLPADIRWHFIGHLQKNKVKYLAPFVHLIHGVDSVGLLGEINKQAIKNKKSIDCLLQVHIAEEETKFGFNDQELAGVAEQLLAIDMPWPQVNVKGLMGMASFTEDTQAVRNEFSQLKRLFDRFAPVPFSVLSMGMSNDYSIAVEQGSNMVRIGSLLFGRRA